MDTTLSGKTMKKPLISKHVKGLLKAFYSNFIGA
jgi:hypothetical protein